MRISSFALVVVASMASARYHVAEAGSIRKLLPEMDPEVRKSFCESKKKVAECDVDRGCRWSGNRPSEGGELGKCIYLPGEHKSICDYKTKVAECDGEKGCRWSGNRPSDGGDLGKCIYLPNCEDAMTVEQCNDALLCEIRKETLPHFPEGTVALGGVDACMPGRAELEAATHIFWQVCQSNSKCSSLKNNAACGATGNDCVWFENKCYPATFDFNSHLSRGNPRACKDFSKGKNVCGLGGASCVWNNSTNECAEIQYDDCFGPDTEKCEPHCNSFFEVDCDDLDHCRWINNYGGCGFDCKKFKDEDVCARAQAPQTETKCVWDSSSKKCKIGCTKTGFDWNGDSCEEK